MSTTLADETTRRKMSIRLLRSAGSRFFFSSRRRHTRLQGDWSSDVCSSDLRPIAWKGLIVLLGDARRELDQSFPGDRAALERGVRSVIVAPLVFGDMLGGVRSEERRVGKECRSRWSPYH